MTQTVERSSRWPVLVAAHGDPVTRRQLFELARDEETSVSTIVCRAVARELERARTEEGDR